MYKRFLNDYFIHFINFYDWIKYNFCILVLGIGYFWIWSTKSYYMLGLFCTRKFRQHYLAFHFIFIILYRFSCPFSIARFYSYFTYIFFFFLLLFSLFTGPLPLSTVLLLPLRNDEKSTEPLIGSVNPIEGTRTLMGWCRLERMEERWNDEAWVTSTGKIRYGNTTFRENNFHYSCMPFLLRSFVFSFFFFFLYFSTRFIIGFSIFFS